MKTAALILGVLLVMADGALSVAWAQQGKGAHIGYVFPAGARQGETVTVKIGGENVYGACQSLVSGAGVTVEVVDSLDPNEGVMDPKKKNRKKNEAVIDEIITLKVTVAPDAEPGDRDICLVTTNMISNKLIFQVGQMAEIIEVEPNNKRKTATAITSFPVLVNGQIMPGDVDWFRFKATKGQQLVVEAAARRLLPYIADGVPGWFQAIIALQDPRSNEVAVADSYKFEQDPVLLYTVPEDGEYGLSIRDSIYRGREDFGYRLRIGELPFITGIYPLGGPVETNAVRVRLAGVNLPVEFLEVERGAGVAQVRHLVVTNKGLLSNQVRFEEGKIAEIVEAEPATDIKRAKTVGLPVVINGCIRAAGEKHYYRFTGRKDQSVKIEVHARRLGSAMDSTVALLDGTGTKIASNDDLKNAGEGFMTYHADSGLTCILPGDGDYMVMIADTQGRGGEEYAYRLRLGEPIPGFDLRVTPAALFIPQGGSAPAMIHVIRQDGFSGPIDLRLQGASGLTLDGARVPPGVDKVPVTVSATTKTSGRYSLRVSGAANDGAATIVREAVPAENLMQAFLYQHLLPFQEETAVVVPPPVPFWVALNLPPDGVLTLIRGKETNVTVQATRGIGYSAGIRLDLVDAPKGMSFRNAWVATNRETATVVIRADSNVATNLQGNLIMTATMQVEREATEVEKARMAERAAREKAAREAVIGTNTAASGTNVPAMTAASTNATTAAREDKPVMVKRPVVVTLAAVPFRVVEPPPPAKLPPKPIAAATNAPPKATPPVEPKAKPSETNRSSNAAAATKQN